jgi:FtsH-binding integral membrane protein
MANSSIYNKYFGSGGKHSGHAMYNLMGGASRNKGKGIGTSSLLSLLNSKKEFLVAVFANLIAQLGITYFFMMNYTGADKKNFMFWGLVVVQFIIIIVLALVPMPTWLKFILFSVFSACSGMTLSFMKRSVDPNIIDMAIVGTLSIFGVMFLFGVTLILFGINLGSQFAAFLFYALLLLIIVQVVMIFAKAKSSVLKGIYIFSLILFSLYIIYDTNNILQRDYYGDFITASLDYYLDILNIFVDLVGIFDN